MSGAPHSPTDSDLHIFLSAYPPRIRSLALELRALVCELVPSAVEEIDRPARLLGYSYDRTYRTTICVIMPLKAAVNLGLARGVDLPDPAGLLTGTGKRARHVKITSSEQVRCPALRALLEAAADITPH